jgi:hypothetical protein
VEYRLVGYVIQYRGDPDYKTIDGFLKVENWKDLKAGHESDLSNATFFQHLEEARQWAERFPWLMGEKGYLAPLVVPCWRVSTYTLTDPNKDTMGELAHQVELMVARRHTDISY